jgi:hypothetical protein
MNAGNGSLPISHPQLPEQQTHHGLPFPLVVQCDAPAADGEAVAGWIGKQRDELIPQAREHGAILFRGFPVRTPEDFDRFITAFGFENFPYEQSLSNAVRINFTPRVFSANEAPPDVTIFLHHEMAQTPIFPGKLFFFCQQPAEQGATPLCRSDVLFERMTERCPQFARDCEQKGLRYSNVMPSANDATSGMGRSWQLTFRSETREGAEQRMRELGYSWEWLPDGCLRATTPPLPGVHEVAPGRKTFFNQLIAAAQGWKDARNDPSKAITHGDGTPLDRDAVQLVAAMAEELTFDTPWQQGDVALVDNFVVMHAFRTEFSRPRR